MMVLEILEFIFSCIVVIPLFIFIVYVFIGLWINVAGEFFDYLK